MNTKVKLILPFLFFLFITGTFRCNAQRLTPKEIIHQSEAKYNGELCSYGEMTMTIVRPKYKRTLKFKSWVNKNKKSLAVITAPAKEKGQSFLKEGKNLWNWNPTIHRLIKLPPSMMSQGWMGSDISNDDIMKEFSLEKDYTHHLNGEENIAGQKCWKIDLLPLAEANVVWGKVILWISKKGFDQMKAEYYDEDLYLVKTHQASHLQKFDDRTLPSITVVIPAEDPDNQTRIQIDKMTFNHPTKANFYTQQNMKRLK